MTLWDKKVKNIFECLTKSLMPVNDLSSEHITEMIPAPICQSHFWVYLRFSDKDLMQHKQNSSRFAPETSWDGLAVEEQSWVLPVDPSSFMVDGHHAAGSPEQMSHNYCSIPRTLLSVTREGGVMEAGGGFGTH